MRKRKKARIDLQLFAGGAVGADPSGAAAGDAGGTVESKAADDGLQRLRELGVPEDKIAKRAKKQGSGRADRARPDAGSNTLSRDAAGRGDTAPQNDAPASASTRLTWEEIMADPEYNSRMQEIVQKRLRQHKGGEAATAVSGGGMDSPAQGAADAATAPQEAAAPNRAALHNAQAQEAAMQRHFIGLRAQEQTMRRSIPGFDLAAELKNPAFARLVAPGSPVSLEAAYYALHRDARSSAAENAARAAVEDVAKRIRAGQSRPNENGGLPQAASISKVDVKDKAYRDSIKRQMREAAAGGRKLYPGGTAPLR